MAVQVVEVVCLLAPMRGEVSDGKHLERLSSGLLVSLELDRTAPGLASLQFGGSAFNTRLDHDMTLPLRVLERLSFSLGLDSEKTRFSLTMSPFLLIDVPFV